jgi:hypothetical protein
MRTLANFQIINSIFSRRYVICFSFFKKKINRNTYFCCIVHKTVNCVYLDSTINIHIHCWWCEFIISTDQVIIHSFTCIQCNIFCYWLLIIEFIDKIIKTGKLQQNILYYLNNPASPVYSFLCYLCISFYIISFIYVIDKVLNIGINIHPKHINYQWSH